MWRARWIAGGALATRPGAERPPPAGEEAVRELRGEFEALLAKFEARLAASTGAPSCSGEGRRNIQVQVQALRLKVLAGAPIWRMLEGKEGGEPAAGATAHDSACALCDVLSSTAAAR